MSAQKNNHSLIDADDSTLVIIDVQDAFLDKLPPRKSPRLLNHMRWIMDNGYRVAVVNDATGSPAPGQEMGINRMRSAGALIVNTKGLFYEWMRTIEMVNRFHRECPHMRDLAGVVL
jgi:hypothetical protein